MCLFRLLSLAGRTPVLRPELETRTTGPGLDTGSFGHRSGSSFLLCAFGKATFPQLVTVGEGRAKLGLTRIARQKNR